MLFLLKKLLFILILNSSLFLILIIGIQNSSNKKEVELVVSKTINLPIGFITGVSFISGSLLGGLLTVNLTKNKD